MWQHLRGQNATKNWFELFNFDVRIKNCSSNVILENQKFSLKIIGLSYMLRSQENFRFEWVIALKLEMKEIKLSILLCIYRREDFELMRECG